MYKENSPLFSDEFLDELTKDINEKYGWPNKEENLESIHEDE
ncbi:MULTISPECIES: bacitracin ABC transporter ATP-binding protein [Bacillaceae]